VNTPLEPVRPLRDAAEPVPAVPRLTPAERESAARERERRRRRERERAERERARSRGGSEPPAGGVDVRA
jgi:hypothetical protein